MEQVATPKMILSENRLARLATVALFYFTQGVPTGFFYVALPAWLAVEGYGAGDIAAVVSATSLPHSLKFLYGFVMDRYTFLPMGRRRAWILGAQLMLCASLVLGAIVTLTDFSIFILSALGMMAAFSWAFQDVGIDSLAIDIMPDDERGKAAGLMFGSAMLGLAFMTWAGGIALEQFGLSAAFAVTAAAPVTVLVFGIFIREREGERRLPWSSGQAHPRNRAIQIEAWTPLLASALRALLTPLSLLLALALFSRSIPVGVADTLHPILATRGAGWKLTDYTDVLTLSQLTAGVLSLFVFGAIVTRIGAQRSMWIGALLMAAMYGAMVMAQSLWTDRLVLTAFLFGYDTLALFVQVSAIAITMRFCSPAVAASQFPIYMALANMGRPVGAMISGALGEQALDLVFTVLIGLNLALVALLLLVRFPAQESPAAVIDLAPEAT